MTRLYVWVSTHGGTLVIGALCFLFGVGVSVPLGWHLPDTYSSMFGSAAGSIAAVGGAILLWQLQQAHAGARTADGIYKYMQFLILTMKAFVDESATGSDITEIRKGFGAFLFELERTNQRLTRLHPFLNMLPERSWNQLLLMEALLDAVEAETHDIANHFRDDDLASVRVSAIRLANGLPKIVACMEEIKKAN